MSGNRRHGASGKNIMVGQGILHYARSSKTTAALLAAFSLAVAVSIYALIALAWILQQWGSYDLPRDSGPAMVPVLLMLGSGSLAKIFLLTLPPLGLLANFFAFASLRRVSNVIVLGVILHSALMVAGTIDLLRCQGFNGAADGAQVVTELLRGNSDSRPPAPPAAPPKRPPSARLPPVVTAPGALK